MTVKTTITYVCDECEAETTEFPEGWFHLTRHESSLMGAVMGGLGVDLCGQVCLRAYSRHLPPIHLF